MKPDEWPTNIVTAANKETEVEARKTREVLAVAIEIKDEADDILEKHSFWRRIRIMAWMTRFLHNGRVTKLERVRGPLSTDETEAQIKWWIKRERVRYSTTDELQEDHLRLNLQKKEEGIYECRGRI